MATGLTNAGFVTKNYDEVRQGMIDDLKNTIDPNLNFDSTSILGSMLDIFSRNLHDLWQASSGIYGSRYINSATGQSLDKIVSLIGIQRIQARRTAGFVYLIGDVGTIVPTGTTFTNSQGNIYETLQLDSLVAGTPPILRISRPAGNTGERIVLFNKNDLHGLFQSQESTTEFSSFMYSDDASVIREALGDYFGDVIESVTRNTDNDIIITFSENMFLPQFTVQGFDVIVDVVGLADGLSVYVASIVDGSIPLASGQLNEFVDTVLGLSNVINFSDFTTGRVIETDSQLRDRWFRAVSSSNQNSRESIENAVRSVSGVIQAIVFEANGVVEVVVSGGDPDLIAKQIYDTKPAGVTLSGDGRGETRDGLESLVIIPFSRPTSVSFDVRVTIQKNQQFIGGGESLIRDLLSQFQSGFRIGSILRPAPDMIWALRTVLGLEFLDIEISNVLTGSDFSSDFVVLRDKEFPVFRNINIIERAS